MKLYLKLDFRMAHGSCNDYQPVPKRVGKMYSARSTKKYYKQKL